MRTFRSIPTTNFLPYAAIALLGAMPISSASAQADQLSAEEQALIDQISAQSMRGHLSFIASDTLGGRDTPSPGLDLAAEYIAAQFRRAGLEPVGDDGYFQTATMQTAAPKPSDFACSIRIGGQSITIGDDQFSIVSGSREVDVSKAAIAKVAFPVGDVTLDVNGPTVLVTDMPSMNAVPQDERRAFFGQYNELLSLASQHEDIVAIVTVDPSSEAGSGIARVGRMGRGGGVPVFTLHGEQLATSLGFGGKVNNGIMRSASIELQYKLPESRQVPVRNVVAMLRGSDPELADTYILVTGHYDHVGTGAPDADGDGIFNGANDDGSGTVSVIEIASAFAAAGIKPRRSILFMTVYGEERGLLGSRYFAENPIVPLNTIIANVNLEHMGRTDDSEGEKKNLAMLTGFDFTSLHTFFQRGADLTDIELYHHPRNSDSFFARSDNVAFAGLGIPAHTFCTAFIFPDYHGVGDHWELIDYDNMAKVDRMIAIGVYAMANSDEVPAWTEGHRRTGRYIDAWRELHGK